MFAVRLDFRFGVLASAALLILFAAHTAPHLTRTLHYDEAYTGQHFAVSPVRALLSYTEPNNHMLHSFFAWFSRQIVGDSPFALRLPAFTAALIGLALIQRIGTRLGGHAAGIGAAVLLALCYTYVDYAVNARGYTLAICLTLVFIDLVFLRPPGKRQRNSALLLTSAALILTLPSMLLLVVCGIAFAVQRSVLSLRRERAYRALIAPQIVGVVIGGMFYLPAALYGELTRQAARFGNHDLATFITEVLTTWFPSPIIGIVAFGLAVVGLMLIGRRDERTRQMIMFVGGGALILTALQWLVTRSVFYGRNYLYLAPLIFLVGGLGLAHLLRIARVHPALLLILMLFVPSSGLSAPTQIDAALRFADEYLSDTDTLVMGCCIDEPVRYTLIHARRAPQVITGAHTRRVFLMATDAGDYTALQALAALPIETCVPLDYPPFYVWRCDVRAT